MDFYRLNNLGQWRVDKELIAKPFASRKKALVRRKRLGLGRFGKKLHGRECLTLKLLWLFYTNDSGILILDLYTM